MKIPNNFGETIEQEDNLDYLIKLLEETNPDLDNLKKYLDNLFKKNNQKFKNFLEKKYGKVEYYKIINKINILNILINNIYDENISNIVGGINKQIIDLLNLLNKN